MRVISCFQPWAQIIAERRTRTTTKAWPVEPGILAICAANKVNADVAEKHGYDPTKLTQGAIIAIVEVTECIPLPNPKVRHSKFFHTFTDLEGREHTSDQEGRFAIKFTVLKKLRKPHAVQSAKNKVWDIPDGEIWPSIGILHTTVKHASLADGEKLGVSAVENCSGSTESERSTLVTSK